MLALETKQKEKNSLWLVTTTILKFAKLKLKGWPSQSLIINQSLLRKPAHGGSLRTAPL